MSDAPLAVGCAVSAIGPGRLILVVGPSGAGKDTLLGLARRACGDDGSIVFTRRVVTRVSSAFEDNAYLSPQAFREAERQGAFAAQWEAHGHCYGLPRVIEDDIRAGRTVIANVSRTVVETMRGTYSNVCVVAITAPPEVLARRLALRSRTSDGSLGRRLLREVGCIATADETIANTDSADLHAQQLVEIIKGRGRGESGDMTATATAVIATAGG